MPVPARLSATVVLLRDFGRMEILLGRRNDRATAAPGAWVFPGGTVETSDRDVDDLLSAKNAAVRECFEETSIALKTAELFPISRWITPAALPQRFDTYFFVAASSADAPLPVPDGEEIIKLHWYSTAEALELSGLMFPTRNTIELLARFANTVQAVEWVKQLPSVPVHHPRLDDSGNPFLDDRQTGSSHD